MRATIHQSICRFCRSYKDEGKLIVKIWRGKFPRGFKPRPSCLERIVMTVLILIRILSLSRIKELFRKEECRFFVVELYTVGWLIALCIMLVNSSTSETPMICFCVLCWYRIIDAVNYCLCILFVDRYKRDWHPRSWNRSLILLFIIYLTLIVAFAVLYLQTQSVGADKVALTDWGQAIYFSLVTITTLGYGDYTPLNSTGEWLVVAETMLGFVLVVVIIGAFLTGLHDNKKRPATKDEPKV